MAHILGPQPTWPCLINGFERGHTLHPIQHAIHVPKQMTVVTQFCFFGGNVFWPFAEIYTVLVTDPGPKASHMCLTKKRIYGIFDRLLVEPPVNKSTITLLQFCLGVQY